ncbi:class I SAM-dependent methyltransferase [Gordonia sp. CPCC 206044]|uniref:SAM-dependent methyltransferase n=1 Tax=Gordonia sp. CPCC 206044 TaxID=3140793 RepID=UPI003AF3AAE4
MADPNEILWKVHDGLPREAPGSAATTELLLRLAGPLPTQPRIVDIGCGTGPAAIVLAQQTDGRVTAVDVHEPFLSAVGDRARAAGVADRIDVLDASMDDLPVAERSVDLIWAEGSAYIMGFDAALSTWRSLLSASGVMVLTELEWTTPTPSDGARAFWRTGYPAIRTTAENVAAVQRAGWDVLATYLLPDSDWDNYYEPLTRRVAELRRLGVSDDELAPATEEVDVRAAFGADYGYTGYVLRPR